MELRERLRAKIPGLSPDKLDTAIWLAQSIAGHETLSDFINRVSPHHPPPKHIAPLIKAIEKARWKPVRILVSMPPRHAKTITILHGLAWWIQNSPSDTCAYVSYSDRQALSKSRICRALAEISGLSVSGDSAAASEWRTREGGGLIAAGAGAGITGQGVQGLMVVDDPYKNREEADSEVIREKIWETFNEVVFTRLEGASVIACHTRWHEDDMIGRLCKMGDWEYINLPATAEEKDPMGRAPGEALWPECFPIETLDKIRKQLGEWSFAALYQGHPRPRGHSVFGIETYHTDNRLDGHRIVLYGDPAASKKTTADYGVMLAMALKGFREQRTAKVLEVVRGQWTVPEYTREVRKFQKRWNNAPLWVESVGAFKAVPQTLLEVDPSLKYKIKEHQPEGDKFQRAQGVAAAWNDGRVSVLFGAPWVGAFVDEIRAFTGVSDRHDDQVDCLSGAWNVGSRVGGLGL